MAKALLTINDVPTGAHYVEVIHANAAALYLQRAVERGRLYHTGRGNPDILGERHMSPDYRPGRACFAHGTREVTAPVQSRLSLVVGVRMRYLALGTDLQSPSSPLLWPRCNPLSKIRQPQICVRERRATYLSDIFLFCDRNLIIVLLIFLQSLVECRWFALFVTYSHASI